MKRHERNETLRESICSGSKSSRHRFVVPTLRKAQTVGQPRLDSLRRAWANPLLINSPHCFSLLLNCLSILHHELDFAELRNVGQGIAGHSDDIGEGAGGDDPDL